MRIGGTGHLNDPTGNQTRNLPSFGVVPQSTVPLSPGCWIRTKILE